MPARHCRRRRLSDVRRRRIGGGDLAWPGLCYAGDDDPVVFGSVLIWPDEIPGTFSLGVTSSSAAVAFEADPATPSTLPRITGSPSLPPPMMMIFELRD